MSGVSATPNLLRSHVKDCGEGVVISVLLYTYLITERWLFVFIRLADRSQCCKVLCGTPSVNWLEEVRSMSKSSPAYLKVPIVFEKRSRNSRYHQNSTLASLLLLPL